jgi:SAM-dependent methyltransferase
MGGVVRRATLAGDVILPTSAPSVRACPACGESSTDLIYRQRFASFTAGSIGEGYDVVTCSDCGMCFASGLPDPQRFAQYYADSSKYDLGADGAQLSKRDLARFADQARFVAEHLAERDAPVLDVGTATGGFLVALGQVGFTRLFGVDPSPDAVRFAQRESSLNVTVGGLAEAASFGEKFGLIAYVAVLEHLLEPREQVRAVTRLLRPNGHVFISVPDAGSFRTHVAAPFQEFSVEHINFFTRRSLANTMGAEGYSLVAERSVIQPLGTDGQTPVLEAIFRWDGDASPPQHDESGATEIRQYIEGSERTEAALFERIAALASSGERIYVWGTGTHTLHLLQTSRLAECRIEAFLDSNPHYAGATLVGRPVIAPADLAAADAPILISSAVSQSGIAAAARARFGDDVALILLNEATDGTG